jgi:hypothetical protein
MMEEESGCLLRERLPRQWAIHGYAPDYGIDDAVEIFEFTDETEAYAETLGESFLFQLKAERSCDICTLSVPGRAMSRRPVTSRLTTPSRWRSFDTTSTTSTSS